MSAMSGRFVRTAVSTNGYKADLRASLAAPLLACLALLAGFLVLTLA